MHFRVRGNNVQIVKTDVDKKTLQSKSVPAGSANIKTGVLSDELLSKLTEKEVQEVRRWIEARQRINALRQEVEAHQLPARIEEATAWLAGAEPAKVADIAQEIERAVGKLRRTMMRGGLIKRKPQKGAGSKAG